MSLDRFDALAKEDFNRARTRQIFGRLLSLLKNEKDQLMSLQEVKALLRPTSESYRGMKTVPIAQIVGSEGRYQDFNRTFLPRHSHLKGRWVSVDKAHHQQIILPAVTLYEIGGVYFVRDGNHRVSVARLQGVEFIDAEVISLGSRLAIDPGMNVERLKQAVIGLECKEFLKQTRLDSLRPGMGMDFSATGRYDEIIRHINGHKYYMNLGESEEISFKQAMLSWYDNVYEPIVRLIETEDMLRHFPGRTASDLYVWVVRHWDELKRKYGQSFPLQEAVQDFTNRYGRTKMRLTQRILAGLRRKLTGCGKKTGKREGDEP